METQQFEQLTKMLVEMDSARKKEIDEVRKGLSGVDHKEQFAKIEADLTETNKKLVEAEKKAAEADKLAKELETKLARRGNAYSDAAAERKSLGQQVVEALQGEQFKGLERGKQLSLEVKNTPILTDPSARNTLVQEQRIPGVIQIPNIPLTIRSVMSATTTESNAIQYVKESSFTNNAGPQYSPTTSPAQVDGATKRQSSISYTLVTKPVATNAHYIKVARQLLSDFNALRGEIDNRLTYGLGIEEEGQLLYGTGIEGEIEGVITQADAYDTSLNVSGDTKLDKLRHALYQVTRAKQLATAIVLNPKDWHDIELLKTEDGGSNKGTYIVGNPSGAQLQPSLWGLPVVPSLSINIGQFLTGNTVSGAQIFDREGVTIRFYEQNEDDAKRNLVMILAENRLVLAVYRSDAFVRGTF